MVFNASKFAEQYVQMDSQSKNSKTLAMLLALAYVLGQRDQLIQSHETQKVKAGSK